MDIGLMPLDDSLWSLGKCSYKMLLYMACGVPVVASDIGMNAELLRMDTIGLGARTPDDWHDALARLMGDAGRRHEAGMKGRALVEQHYSLDVVTRQWQDVLSSLVPDAQRL
jgi:glycosyltransferase involved in cell wall biosynthesis